MIQRIVLFLFWITLSNVAFGLDLDQARAQGLVGEKQNGYVGIVVKKPSAEVKALVKTVNQKRSKSYSRLAKKQGISVEAVAKVAAEKLFTKAPPTQYFQRPNGQWVKKGQF